MLLFFWSSLRCSLLSAEPLTASADAGAVERINEAKKWLHVREIGNNKAFNDKVFESKIKKAGWRSGYQWCAYFMSMVLNECKLTFFKIRSGMAQGFKTKKSISAMSVLCGEVTVPKGSFAIWQHGNTGRGHIELTEKDWKGARGETIGGNTSSSVKGSQNDGDCVAEKHRKIEPLNTFRIKYFTIIE